MGFIFSTLIFCLGIPLQIIAWSANYAQELETAKFENKLVLLAFVGRDWCPWSDKFFQETLSEPQFINALKDLVVFVRVDFPYSENAPESEGLKEKYHIQQLPTLVIASPREEEVAKIGYLPLKPSEFAVHIEQILQGYKKLITKIGQRELSELSVEEIRHLYQEACTYHLTKYKEVFFSLGLKLDPGPFFLVEKYGELMKVKPKKAKALRREIEKRDPKNKHGSYLQLAIFDFQAQAEKSEDSHKVLKPLRKYLKKFGQKDLENSWRLHMMIAQYLFHKNGDKKEIVKQVQAALDQAPEEFKNELTEFFNDMEKR